MREDFNDAFDALMVHEGGFVNNPRDPGGATKYGISQRAYPHEDIANLSLDRAKELYRRDYWDKARCDELPRVITIPLFDAAVNNGVSRAIKWLQSAAHVPMDGVFGPQTMRSVLARPPLQVASHIHILRVTFMTNLAMWESNPGWATRLVMVAIQIGVASADLDQTGE